MIQIAADKDTGYLINCDEEQMSNLRDWIDHALENGEWHGLALSASGTVPFLIKVSDEPELVA